MLDSILVSSARDKGWRCTPSTFCCLFQLPQPTKPRQIIPSPSSTAQSAGLQVSEIEALWHWHAVISSDENRSEVCVQGAWGKELWVNAQLAPTMDSRWRAWLNPPLSSFWVNTNRWHQVVFRSEVEVTPSCLFTCGIQRGRKRSELRK